MSGIAALAHDYGFSLGWVMASTVLVWAGPSQVILISALGAGATLLETAIAVGLSCVRFLPMVVALLPLMRGPRTRTHDLLLPAHFTAASMWVESFRLLPAVPPERRVVYCNGLGIGFMSCALCRLRHRLLPDRVAAAAADGGDAVPHADVVPDLDRAQRAHARRSARRWRSA